VHRSTLANAAFPNAHPTITHFEHGIRLSRDIPDCDPSPLHAMAGRFEGKVNFWNRQVWWLPSVFENWAGSAPVGGTGTPQDHPGALHLRHFSLLTPETEKTTHYFWIQPCQFPHGDTSVIEQVGQGIAKAFAEDNWIIEAQQKAWDACPPGTQPMPARNDAALGRIRFMIDEMRQREQAQTPHLHIA
jgi:Vanillate O-demethylase oxygenase C-terminal domain